jgi:hypothetical protein
MPIQSFVLDAVNGAERVVDVRGVAWGGHGGLPVTSVEVRCGRGKGKENSTQQSNGHEQQQHDTALREWGTWHPCNVIAEGDGTLPKWSWTRWDARIVGDDVCLCEDAVVQVRCTDGVNVQPERIDGGMWYLNNSYHMLSVRGRS